MKVVEKSVPFILIVLACLTAGTQPTMSESNDNDIYVGPAVIGCCKHIYFYRPVDPHLDQTLNINCGDKNFGRTKQWIFDNLYGAVNRTKQTGGQQAEYVVALFSQRTGAVSSPMDVLLNVPLNSNTLGPDYQSKIAEFRKLLTDQEETQNQINIRTAGKNAWMILNTVSQLIGSYPTGLGPLES